PFFIGLITCFLTVVFIVSLQPYFTILMMVHRLVGNAIIKLLPGSSDFIFFLGEALSNCFLFSSQTVFEIFPVKIRCTCKGSLNSIVGYKTPVFVRIRDVFMMQNMGAVPDTIDFCHLIAGVAFSTATTV